MSTSTADARESGSDAVTEPGVARPRSRSRRSREANGITITRWSLGLSVTVALTILAGAFTLVWEQVGALRETQVMLVSRVSTLDERVSGLDGRLSRLETEVRELRGEVAGLRNEVIALRDELRDTADDLREEMRILGDLIRARNPGGAEAQ